MLILTTLLTTLLLIIRIAVIAVFLIVIILVVISPPRRSLVLNAPCTELIKENKPTAVNIHLPKRTLRLLARQAYPQHDAAAHKLLQR